MDVTARSKDSIELQIASRNTPNNGDTLFSVSDFSGGNYHSSRDDTTLRRLGKRPLLNRSFGFMSSLGLSCSVLLSWEGILVTSVPTFLSGGSGGVVWAFLIGWVGVTSVYASVAELASAAPTAGGQYHWVAMMAPDSCANFLSYLTAWLTTLAWQAIAITTSYSVATIIQGIVVLAEPSYVAIPWHTVLIMWAAAVFSVLVNSTTGRVLAKFEGLVLILHLTGFFGVLVPMVYFAPHNAPSDVFTTFTNNGGWSTQALAFLVGMPTVASTMTGADCAVHMSEEVRSANIVVPQALLYTIFINGALGFAMVIALLFCISDVPAAVAAADTMFYPFLQIFESAVKSTTGACIMAGVVLVLAIASCISTYASASRMMWSFARDKGLPFDRHLVKLNKNTLPVYAIMCTMGITVLISFIVLGSSVVLSALLSLLLAAIYSSYLLACGLLLYRRVTGAFHPYVPGIDEDPIHSGQLYWGPWKLPEPFGTINNIFACLYTTFLLFWSFWPQANNPSPAELNWSVVVYGSVIVFSIVWYVVRARHYFKGPIKEV
ncbi:amino acid transporter [Hypoxylon sp. FL0890]|nr:amino acid transporter [Hypoxylon sp. FL0890]